MPSEEERTQEELLEPGIVAGAYNPPNANLDETLPHHFEVVVDPDTHVDPSSTWGVEVTNRTQWDAEGYLRLFHSSRAGSVHAAPVAFAAEAGQTVRVEIPAESLQLPTGAFDFSGSLQIIVESHLSNGEKADYIADRVYFHPEGTGWRLYDRYKLHERYAKGRLTPHAHQIIDEAANADLNAEHRLGGDEEEFHTLNIDSDAVFFTSGHAQKVSDSPYFIHRAEADADGGVQ